jgi:hypothetical protein
MTTSEKLETALTRYIDSRRRERQLEITRHFAEMLSEHASRQAQFGIDNQHERSTAFLNRRLRERSR